MNVARRPLADRDLLDDVLEDDRRVDDIVGDPCPRLTSTWAGPYSTFHASTWISVASSVRFISVTTGSTSAPFCIE